MENLQDGAVLAEKLLDLLTRQKTCYGQLQELAGEQRELIRAEKAEALLELLARRQNIVNMMSAIHQELQPYRQDWDHVKATLPAASRGTIQQLLAELEQMLNDLLDHDKQDCDELFSKKQHVADQISTASKGRVATKAYSGNVQAGPTPRRSGMNFEISG